MPTNCLSVFDQFVELGLEGLELILHNILSSISSMEVPGEALCAS